MGSITISIKIELGGVIITKFEKINLGISTCTFIGTIVIILEIAAANNWI